MEKKHVLTLSTANIITNPSLKIEKLLQYFLASDKDQSNYFQKQTSSMKWLIAQYGSNPNDFIIELKNALTSMYKRYFVSVEVNIEFNNNENIDQIILVKRIGVKIDAIDSDNVTGNYTGDIDMSDYK